MAEKRTVNSTNSLQDAKDWLDALWQKHHYVKVSAIAGTSRSMDQNSMFFELYTHIADWFYSGDIDLARAECKLNYGISILRRDDPEFNDLCSRTLDMLSYEEQLRFVRTMSVTSDMTKQQARECITIIMDTYSEQGCPWPHYLLKERRRRYD
jgi:hypothetical protein